MYFSFHNLIHGCEIYHHYHVLFGGEGVVRFPIPPHSYIEADRNHTHGMEEQSSLRINITQPCVPPLSLFFSLTRWRDGICTKGRNWNDFIATIIGSLKDNLANERLLGPSMYSFVEFERKSELVALNLLLQSPISI